MLSHIQISSLHLCLPLPPQGLWRTTTHTTPPPHLPQSSHFPSPSLAFFASASPLTFSSAFSSAVKTLLLRILS